MARVIRLLIVVALVCGGAYLLYQRLFGGMPGHPGMMGMGGPAAVTAAQAIERTVRPSQVFSGRLVAAQRAEIRARVSGTIEAVHFTEGERVEKGAPLFTIDPRAYVAALESAAARAKLADTQFERAKELLKSQAISPRDFDQRRNDAQVARAELTRARLDMEHTKIAAPIAGRVSRAEITAGNLVDAGGISPVLTTIVSDKPIYADFDVDERTFLIFLQAVGSAPERLRDIPVTVTLAGDQGPSYEGRIQSFDNELRLESGTVRVRASLPNEDGSLIPGLFARVSLSSPQEITAVLVAERAIGTDQNRKFLWVVGDGGKAERRDVTLGGMDGGLRIIESGLKGGETVIIDGLQRIMMPGQPVAPEMAPMEQPPL